MSETKRAPPSEFIAQRTDGKPMDVDAKCFVLRYDEMTEAGHIARIALAVYATCIEDHDLTLSKHLQSEVALYEKKYETSYDASDSDT